MYQAIATCLFQAPVAPLAPSHFCFAAVKAPWPAAFRTPETPSSFGGVSTSSPSFQKAATLKTRLTNEFLGIKVEGLGSTKGALWGVSDRGCLVLLSAHYEAEGRGSGSVLRLDRDQACGDFTRPAAQVASVEPHADWPEGSLPPQGCRGQ